MPIRIVVFTLLLGVLSGCVQQGDLAALQNRVNQQDQAIRQLNSQLSSVQPAQADTWSQVQAMRQEMADIKGQIDNLNHAASSIGGVAGLSDRVARHDAALRLLEKQLALNLSLNSPAPPVPMPAASPMGALPQGLPEAAVSASAPDQATPASAANADIAKALYDAGYAAFTAGKYDESLQTFTDFTTTYPKHPLIGNAWFWKAESSFGRKEYHNAVGDYQKVITNYPSSQKAPSAYLKQAVCFANTNKKDVARIRLEDLIKKFPASPEAARAKKMLAELK